jgi:hypothetical protein
VDGFITIKNPDPEETRTEFSFMNLSTIITYCNNCGYMREHMRSELGVPPKEEQ